MMGIKRRNFLIGAAVVAGAGVFGTMWADGSARKRAISATVKPGEGGFNAWIKIAPDDTVKLGMLSDLRTAGMAAAGNIQKLMAAASATKSA